MIGMRPSLFTVHTTLKSTSLNDCGTVIQSEARLLTDKPPASPEQGLWLYSSFQYNN